MILNLMHFYNFHCPLVNEVKMFLFWLWTRVRQNILIIRKIEGPAGGLDDTAVTTEAKYFINTTMSRKKICLSLHYHAANSFLYSNGVKIYQFKSKDSEIKPYPICLGNISKSFTVDNMKKVELNGKVHNFSVNYETIDISDIANTHKYLIKNMTLYKCLDSLIKHLLF